MFDENQPRMPSARACKPGARMVFISVCPVLKSLPPMGVPVFSASSTIAGMSHVRFGAPLTKGMP